MHFRGQSHVDAISNTVWGWHKWWLVAWAGHVAGMVGVHGETMQPNPTTGAPCKHLGWGWHKWWLAAWADHVASVVGVHGKTMHQH